MALWQFQGENPLLWELSPSYLTPSCDSDMAFFCLPFTIAEFLGTISMLYGNRDKDLCVYQINLIGEKRKMEHH